MIRLCPPHYGFRLHLCCCLWPLCRTTSELPSSLGGDTIYPWAGTECRSSRAEDGDCNDESSGERLVARLRSLRPGGHPNVFPNVWSAGAVSSRVIERVRLAGFAALDELAEVPGARVTRGDRPGGVIGVCRWAGWWLSFDAADEAVLGRVRMLGNAVGAGNQEDGRALLEQFISPMPASVQGALAASLGEDAVSGGEDEGSPGAGDEKIPGTGDEGTLGAGGEQTPETGDGRIPGAGDEGAPGAGGEKTPGTGDGRIPGAGDEKIPGAGDEGTPGAGGEKTPGTGDGRIPGAGDEKIPGAGDEGTPGAGGEKTPGTGDGRIPGAGDEKIPGTGDEGTPGAGGEKTPGTGDGRIPRAGDEKIPGTGDEGTLGAGGEKTPGTGDGRIPGAGDEKIPGTGDEGILGAGGEKTPGTGDGRIPGAGDEKIPGTGDEGTPGAGGEKTPGTGDGGIPGAGGERVPGAGNEDGAMVDLFAGDDEEEEGTLSGIAAEVSPLVSPGAVEERPRGSPLGGCSSRRASISESPRRGEGMGRGTCRSFARPGSTTRSHSRLARSAVFVKAFEASEARGNGTPIPGRQCLDRADHRGMCRLTFQA